MASQNPCGKTRKIDNPYEVWKAGDWEWRVLKKYQSPEKEAQNPYARWFCAVQSPFTMEGWEYGDVSASEVKGSAELVEKNY